MPEAKPDETKVKRYYIDVERYDWVIDPKYPEKLFHVWREHEIAKWINRYGQGAAALDLGCGTGLITRHLKNTLIVALDINQWAAKRAKRHIPLRECNVFRAPSAVHGHSWTVAYVRVFLSVLMVLVVRFKVAAT